MEDRSPITAPETAGARREEGREVPAGFTEVRLPNGVYQWLSREQVARRRVGRRAGPRDARRRRWGELAAALGALLLVFAIAGAFVHCRVREAASLIPPERPAAPGEQIGFPPARE